MELLSPQEIIDSFNAALGKGVIDARIDEKEFAAKKNVLKALWIHVKKDAFKAAVEHLCRLQEHPHLAIISSYDRGEDVELIYHFVIYYERHRQGLSVGIRVQLPKKDLKIPTVTDLIPGAVWTERETQEMMGVEVVGIPDNRRLFMVDDVPEGVHPWRKDDKKLEELLRVLPGRQPKQDK